MVKNIVFDIGNVLMLFQWKKYIHTLFTDEALIYEVENCIWRSGLWNELDRNVLAEEEIFHRMRNFEPQYKKDVVKALSRVDECISPTEYAVPWVQELKAAGLHVYFLSNYSPFLQRLRPDVLNFIPYMDGGVFSCDVQEVKPARAIYSILCQKYNLQPAECLFLDDKPENIEAAKEFGMQGIVFTGYEAARAELEKVLATNNVCKG